MNDFTGGMPPLEEDKFADALLAALALALVFGGPVALYLTT